MNRRLALALALLVGSHAAEAKPRKRPRYNKRVVHPGNATETPAYRYGQLSQEACEAELTTRGIEFQREEARGVMAPVRVLGPLHGITVRTDLPKAARETTRWEIADCRLVLAIDDFTAQLAAHDVTEIVHYSEYRPPSKKWPEGKLGSQHAGALAIDAARFVKSDGHALVVDDDFYGRIGDKTCGPDAAPRRRTPASKELRTILCDAVDAHLFNIVLTPNFNRPHHNHFHLEVTGATWFLVH